MALVFGQTLDIMEAVHTNNATSVFESDGEGDKRVTWNEKGNFM